MLLPDQHLVTGLINGPCTELAFIPINQQYL